MKIRQLVAKDALRVDGAPRAEHLLALDAAGRIWERFSDMPEGEWSIVPGPSKPQQRRSRKQRKVQ